MFEPQHGVAALRVPNFSLAIVESGPALGSVDGETYVFTSPPPRDWRSFNGLHLGTMLRDLETSTVEVDASPSPPAPLPEPYELQLTDHWPVYTGRLWATTNESEFVEPIVVIPPAWYAVRVGVRSRRSHSKEYSVTGETWLVNLWPIAEIDVPPLPVPPASMRRPPN